MQRLQSARYLLLLIGALAFSAHALDGMVLLISAKEFSNGDLNLRYLSSGHQITLDGGSCFGPSFSPDGKKVAYSEGNSKIYIIDINGSGRRLVTTCGGKEVMITWASNGYLYWSQCDKHIYRVKTDGSGKETVFTSGRNIHGVGVSQDGSRAAWTYPSWNVGTGNLPNGNQVDRMGGCQGSISPNGEYFTHNLGSHMEAKIHYFGGGTYKTIKTPEDRNGFNAHRWSHSENDYCMYTIEGDKRAYVHNIKSNTATYVGYGTPYDYYAQEINPGPAEPSISLSATSLSFSGEIGGAISPAQSTIEVTNGSPGTTLDDVTISGVPAWLTVDISGSGDQQSLVNTPDISSFSENTTVEATIEVTAANASPSTVSYTVSLTVSAPVPQSPYSGSPIAIPGTVEAEHFDLGGEGTAYHDDDADNQGGELRDEGVDVQDNGAGGFNVGWTADGEWLEYTVTVAEAGAYNFAFTIAAPSGGGRFHVLNGSENLTGTVDVASTGGWTKWETLRASNVQLDAGEQVWRLVFESGEFNFDKFAVTPFDDSPAIVVLSPAAGQDLVVGEKLRVDWEADCQRVPGVSILLSVDNGKNYAIIEASGTIDCDHGLWEWTIPETVEGQSTVSEQCLVKVKNYSGAEEAVSEKFVIHAGSTAFNPGAHGAYAMPFRVIPDPRGGIRIRASGDHACILYNVKGEAVWSAQSRTAATHMIASNALPAGGYLLSYKSGNEMYRRYLTLGRLSGR